MSELHRRAIFAFVQLIGTLVIFLFLPAGTLDFWQAWLFLFVFAASWALIIGYLWKHDPQLLARRVGASSRTENRTTQRRVRLLAMLAFMGTLLVAALDHRLGWSNVPTYIVIGGNLLVSIGCLIILAVFRENSFAAAAIQLAPDQRVVSTGPYAIVRHPMYTGVLIMVLGTPLALGSWWGVVMLVPITLVVVLRLLDEETFLSEHLSGYREYVRKVRYRLIPSIW